LKWLSSSAQELGLLNRKVNPDSCFFNERITYEREARVSYMRELIPRVRQKIMEQNFCVFTSGIETERSVRRRITVEGVSFLLYIYDAPKYAIWQGLQTQMEGK